jgi:hypothetical protein
MNETTVIAIAMVLVWGLGFVAAKVGSYFYGKVGE